MQIIRSQKFHPTTLFITIIICLIFLIFILSSSITYSDVRKKLPTNKNGKRIRDTVKENDIDKKKSIHYIEDQHINNNNIRDGDFQNNNLKQVINRNNVSI